MLRRDAILALAAIAVATLALRVAPLVGTEPFPDGDAKDRIVTHLKANAYEIRVYTEMSGIAMVGGTKPGCKTTVAQLSLQGWQNDVVTQVRQPGDRLFYVFRGERYDNPPTQVARMAYFTDRLRRSVGMARENPALYGVLASEGCRDAELTSLG